MSWLRKYLLQLQSASVLNWSVGMRMAVVLPFIAVLWLAVGWAVF